MKRRISNKDLADLIISFENKLQEQITNNEKVMNELYKRNLMEMHKIKEDLMHEINANRLQTEANQLNIEAINQNIKAI